MLQVRRAEAACGARSDRQIVIGCWWFRYAGNRQYTIAECSTYHRMKKKCHASVPSRSTHIRSQVVSLWQALLECVRRCYAVFDTALLAKLSSLLQVAFSSKYRDLKDHTVAFWNETFARTPTLEYPPALVPLFRRIKQLYALTLPNWNADAQPSASAAANDALLASCSATEGLDDPSVHVPPVVQAGACASATLV